MYNVPFISLCPYLTNNFETQKLQDFIKNNNNAIKDRDIWLRMVELNCKHQTNLYNNLRIKTNIFLKNSLYNIEYIQKEQPTALTNHYDSCFTNSIFSCKHNYYAQLQLNDR